MDKIKEVVEDIESEGYTIIGEIINKTKQISLVCPNGHARQCSYNSFKKYKCRYCENEQKLQELISSIEDNGYFFIKYPKNARDVAIAECKNGHIRETKIHNFNNFECNECVGRNVKKDITFCKDVFESRGFTLLEDEYINCKTMMKYICTCGRELETTLDIVLNSKISSCTKCKGKKYSGELSSNWRGGISEERTNARKSKYYARWRRAVFKRDKYTCQCCGEIGGKLRGHHILSFAENKEFRYDIKNGITLCNKCHDPGQENSFHSLYGNKNSTMEQFEEFLSMYKTSQN